MTPLIIAPEVVIRIVLKPGKNGDVDVPRTRWGGGDCANIGAGITAAATPTRLIRHFPEKSHSFIGFLSLPRYMPGGWVMA